MRKTTHTKKRRRRRIPWGLLFLLIFLAGGIGFLRPSYKPIQQEEITAALGFPYKVQTLNESNKRPAIKRRIKYIVVHNTANENSTAQNERDYLSNPLNTSSTSWHIAVDEKEAIEAVPLNEVAYHAGDKEGNQYGIGIEVCESGNQEKTNENAAKVIAYLMKEYHIPIDRVLTHKDFSGKECPRLLLQHWDEFLEQIENQYQVYKDADD